MGQGTTKLLNQVFGRFVKTPVQDEPCSYQLAAKYDLMGNVRPTMKQDDNQPGVSDEVHRMSTLYYVRLQERHRANVASRYHERVLKDKSDLYPGWTPTTIQYLYNLYLLYFDDHNGQMDFDAMCALLEDVGYREPANIRRVRFARADPDSRGLIDFDQVLGLLYSDDEFPESPKKHALGSVKEWRKGGKKLTMTTAEAALELMMDENPKIRTGAIQGVVGASTTMRGLRFLVHERALQAEFLAGIPVGEQMLTGMF